MKTKTPDPLKPSLTLLMKLGSAVVHAEEYLASGEPLDRTAFATCIDDAEVQAWIKAMGVYLPVKR